MVRLIMSIKKEIASRITTSRKNLGITIKELSARTKTLSAGRISNWEQGTRTPGPTEAKLLATTLDVAASYLLGMSDDPRGELTLNENSLPNCIPMLSHDESKTIQISTEKESVALSPFSTEQEKLFMEGNHEKKPGPRTFATKVDDNSMSPEFLPNDIVIADPNQKPKPGKFVIAQLTSSDDIVIRRYREITTSAHNEYDLIPLNPDWRTHRIRDNDEGRVLATIIE